LLVGAHLQCGRGRKDAEGHLLGNFETTGNTALVSVGVNYVLIRDRLEFGGAYTRVARLSRR
jgi:hypothetical protein